MRFGGSGVVNKGAIRVKKTPDHDMKQSITLTVPPLSVVFLKGRPRKAAKAKKAEGKPSGEKSSKKAPKADRA